jgi:DNA replication protein DnaC
MRRYEKGAIIVNSNRLVENWGKVLGDNSATGVILDRFLHHAEIIKLGGKSCCMHDRREQLKSLTDQTLTDKKE